MPPLSPHGLCTRSQTAIPTPAAQPPDPHSPDLRPPRPCPRQAAAAQRHQRAQLPAGRRHTHQQVLCGEARGATKLQVAQGRQGGPGWGRRGLIWGCGCRALRSAAGGGGGTAGVLCGLLCGLLWRRRRKQPRQLAVAQAQHWRATNGHGGMRRLISHVRRGPSEGGGCHFVWRARGQGRAGAVSSDAARAGGSWHASDVRPCVPARPPLTPPRPRVPACRTSQRLQPCQCVPQRDSPGQRPARRLRQLPSACPTSPPHRHPSHCRPVPAACAAAPTAPPRPAAAACSRRRHCFLGCGCCCGHYARRRCVAGGQIQADQALRVALRQCRGHGCGGSSSHRAKRSFADRCRAVPPHPTAASAHQPQTARPPSAHPQPQARQPRRRERRGPTRQQVPQAAAAAAAQRRRRQAAL